MYQIGFRKKYFAEVRLARVVAGFAFCVFFVDHVEDQLCDNDFSAYTNLIDKAIARISVEFKWLNNKKNYCN